MDKLTKTERSVLMSRIRSRDSKPELIVRRTVHRMGFRYRLHLNKLPGSPDLVFARRKKIIFVHGCFGHGHDCRAGRNRPESHREYWDAKLERRLPAVRAAGGKIPPDLTSAVEPYPFTIAGTIEELEHFEDAIQLSDPEIDALADRNQVAG